MAKKSIQKSSPQLIATQAIANEAWQVASRAHDYVTQFQAQFRAIREELGGRGNAASLAGLGVLVAKIRTAALDEKMREIREALQDANVPSLSEFAS
ncbi:MAG TPA: hypothetical protein VGH81_10710 [Rudaea sp.]|jgi:hypothetical protein